MRWTKEQLDAYEQRRSKAAIASQWTTIPMRQAPGAEFEQAAGDAPLGKAQGTQGHPDRYKVSITSYRKRLTDPDNLIGKYFVDALRYEGLIPDDNAAVMEYGIKQVKSKKEFTLIMIERL